MWDFNSIVFLNQDNLIQLFSDEKKLTSPEQLKWNQRVKSLKIFIEDMQQLLDRKEISNSMLSYTFKNLVDLNIYILKMNDIKNTQFHKLIPLLQDSKQANYFAIKQSNKKALLYFNSLKSYSENQIFGKKNLSNIQFIFNNGEPFSGDCENSLLRFLQEDKSKNEFLQLLNQHQNLVNVECLHAKIFEKLERLDAGFFFTKIQQYHNITKLKLEMFGSCYFYHSDQFIIVESLISLQKLEILGISGFGVYYLCNQMNRFENIKILEALKIHTLNINVVEVTITSFKFLCNLKKLCKLSIISSYEQNIVDLNQTLLKLNQLSEIKLHLKIKQSDVGELFNTISNLINLKSLALKLSCETSEKQNINIVPSVISNLTLLEKLSITIDNYQFESIHWKQIIQNIRCLNQLQELNLSVFNQIVTDEELIEISQSFKLFNNLTKIRLEFSKKNSFGDGSVFELAKNIRSLANLNYIYLTLLSANISRAATLMLQQSISQLETKPYVHLDISDHETAILQFMKLTDPMLSMLQKKSVFQQICSNKEKIEQYYTYPFLRYDKKSQKVQQEALEKQQNLQLITQTQTNLGVIGIQGIFNGLSHINNLTSLYLKFSYNQIGIEGINLIGQKISSLTQLKELSLHLEEIKIGKDGTYFVYQSLSKLNQLEYLSLFLNEYYEMSEENNIFKFMLNLSKLRLKNQKNVEVLFETISRVKSLKFLMLVQHHSFKNYQFYLNQLMKLQPLKYLSLYVDLNIDVIENEEITLFFTVITTLKNISNLHFTLKKYMYSQNENQIDIQKLFKSSRLVSYLQTYKFYDFP